MALHCTRRSLLSGLTGTAVLGLTACGDDHSGAAPNAPESKPPAPSPSPSKAPATITSADASLVAGLTTVTLKATERGLDVRTPRCSSARNLSQACEVVRSKWLRDAHRDKTDGLAINAQIVASSNDVVGVLLHAGPKDAPTSHCAVWYDARRRQSFASPELISPQRWQAFADAVHAAAEQAGLDPTKADEALIARAAPYGRGPAMVFDTDGALMVLFPSGAVGEQPAQVVVEADGWLSAFGHLAQAASLTPSPYTGKPSVNIAHFHPGENRPKPNQTPNAPLDATGTPSKPTPKGPVRPGTAIGYDAIAERCVALTYDDGPGGRTPELMEAFVQAGATATFFQMGNSINEHPDTTLDLACAGFELASHSVTHPDLARQSRARVKKEVEDNSALLEKVTGLRPMLFRPPYGSHNDMVDEIVKANGMAIAQWSVDTLDWKTRNTAATVQSAVKDGKEFTQPIVLMHDIHDSTVDAAGEIIKQLQADGLQLVTVSELTLNTGGLQAGHAYCRGTGIAQEGYACKG